MVDYSRIRKECYWDLNISEKNIEEILEGSDNISRRNLFHISARNKDIVVSDENYDWIRQ